MNVLAIRILILSSGFLLLLSGAVSADLLRVSVASDGSQGLGDHEGVSISGSGRFVVFDTASGFDPGDTSLVDIYLRDRDTDEDGIFDEPEAVATVLMSVSVDGDYADVGSYAGSISDNGRFLSFYSRARNLTPVRVPASSYSQLYLVDRDLDGDGLFYEEDDRTIVTATPRYSNPLFGGDRSSFESSVSDQGRASSSATHTDIVADDTNDRTQDIFVFDPDPDGDWIFWELDAAPVVTRVSEGSPPPWVGAPWGISGFSSISRDGRFVAYESDAEDLIDPSFCIIDEKDPEPPEPVCVMDIFVQDRDADGDGVYYEPGDQSTVQITLSPEGGPSDGESRLPDISPDGRFVVFTSEASNLVDGELAGTHCYAHDRDTDADEIFDEPGDTATTLVSISTDGTLANDYCSYPSISANGRFVAFHSSGDNLVPDDTNGYHDTFVHDRDVDRDGIFDEPGEIATARINLSPSGSQAVDHSIGRTDFSSDGRWIGFVSRARLLVPEDTNHVPDAYVASNPFFSDSDGDGVEDAEEMGPSGGDPEWDGNDDEIDDWQQSNVASLHTHEGVVDGYVTIAVLPEFSLAGCEAADIPAADAKPDNVSLPLGVFNFAVHGVGAGGAVTVEMHVPDDVELNGYWMYGRTHERSDPHWYEFVREEGEDTGAVIEDAVAYLHFVDGENGDLDLAMNGTILDPGAPALVPEPNASLLAAAGFASIAALAVRRKRGGI